MAHDDIASEPAPGSLAESKSGSDGAEPRDVKDPESIMYDAKTAPDGSLKEAAVGRDGYIDPETAGMPVNTHISFVLDGVR